MLMTELFKAIGIPMITRNLMVDYCDKNGNYFHKPLQTVSPQNFVESDIELTDRIKAELQSHGLTVCGIQEVYGEFEMAELEEVFNGSQYGKHPTRIVFVDLEKAMK